MSKYAVKAERGCCFDFEVIDTTSRSPFDVMCGTHNEVEAEIICNALNAILPPEAMQQLKELRMWHWRQVANLRAVAKNISHNLDKCGLAKRAQRLDDSQAMHRLANYHLTACQALNNVLPGSGEYDCAEADKQAEVIRAQQIR